MNSGMVFDVQRASLLDGPGIRTTIFLKGCPLRCAWCHNPESQKSAPQLMFRADRCTDCRACETACHRGVHDFSGDFHHVLRQRCDHEGHCVRACPSGALALSGRQESVAELLDLVEKDRAYYDASGGGMTLSGGEPLHQADFAIALLAGARARGIHTCVETCGYVKQETLAQAAEHTDLFLYDLKMIDPERHRQLTGGDNQQILANLNWLLARGASVRLRCPMIPKVNTDSSHLYALRDFLEAHPALQSAELLPYHDTGNDKYARIGRQPPPLTTHTPEPREIQDWLNVLTTQRSVEVATA